jgi:hypothetical protein
LRLPDAPPEVFIVVLANRLIDVLLSPTNVVPLLVIVPARLIELGTVAVNPLESVNALVEEFPSVNVPVLLKVVAFVIVVLAPTNDRL